MSLDERYTFEQLPTPSREERQALAQEVLTQELFKTFGTTDHHTLIMRLRLLRSALPGHGAKGETL